MHEQWQLTSRRPGAALLSLCPHGHLEVRAGVLGSKAGGTACGVFPERGLVAAIWGSLEAATCLATELR